MKWLIVEDALRDEKGHYAEYIQTFRDGLIEIGDKVEILCDSQAESWLVEKLNAKAVLPPSIWHRMSDNACKMARMFRIPVHAISTYYAIKKWLRVNPHPDIIFVPSVLSHHLLGWLRLLGGTLKHTKVHVLLFFPQPPIKLDKVSDVAFLADEPSAKLFGWLVKRLFRIVGNGRVTLAAETKAMCKALEEVTGVPFVYLPHPVQVFAKHQPSSNVVTMAVFGPARHEKGSDILQKAIIEYRRLKPASRTHFTIQWISDFKDENGLVIRKDDSLQADKCVRYITEYFKSGEYAEELAMVDVLLLPYRRSSYGLRVSRVVIEAVIHGIPVIATEATTLADQGGEFGACVTCLDGDVPSLVEAIVKAEAQIRNLQSLAMERRQSAVDHFSVKTFKALLLISMNRRAIL